MNILFIKKKIGDKKKIIMVVVKNGGEMDMIYINFSSLQPHDQHQ